MKEVAKFLTENPEAKQRLQAFLRLPQINGCYFDRVLGKCRWFTKTVCRSKNWFTESEYETIKATAKDHLDLIGVALNERNIHALKLLLVKKEGKGQSMVKAHSLLQSETFRKKAYCRLYHKLRLETLTFDDLLDDLPHIQERLQWFARKIKDFLEIV